MKKRVNSRAKGCRGELQFAKELGHYGIHAVRGQQRAGGPDSPDVIHDMAGVHFEVKFNERISVGSKILEEALFQAHGDKTMGDLAVVVWRKSRERWKVTFLMTIHPPVSSELDPSELPMTMNLDDFMYARGYGRNEHSVYVSPKEDTSGNMIPPWMLSQETAG